ncbi:pilus assembly protein PilZ [Thiocystis minor]|uniref:PilZ domain-containing protein n=1 Tax=Thiocystis minor TaxID=61597 RepID=UPI00191146B8|nr:PilZ domain-containing protein [Thiocystis minor]MBK5963889.1 pilus assembly protein PilZ [Thiocystis minor]
MSEQERRRYFRIDDQIGLKLTPIPAADEAAAISGFADASARVGLVNELRAIREKHLPQRRSLDVRFPTVAAYVDMLERQIEVLAFAIDQRDDFPRDADTPVNLSGQGLSLRPDRGLEIGSLVQVRLALFPDRSRIEALARVVKCDNGENGLETALEFSHLRDADREAIIHHVHTLQRLRLQAQALD